MKERPILFNSEMVRAILAGNKTQTRRVIKPQPASDWVEWCIQNNGGSNQYFNPAGMHLNTNRDYPNRENGECPYGAIGDCLWVRETWTCDEYGRRHQSQGMVHYRAAAESLGAWRPSIFMPRWASRITLEITSVRVERVRDISHDDAQAEGVKDADCAPYGFPVTSYALANFRNLWDSINEKRGYGWESNPWVWALTFRPLNRSYPPMR